MLRWVVSIYIILRPQIESPKVLSRKIFFFINNISFKTRKIEGTICHKQNEHKHKIKNKIKKSNRMNILFWTKFGYKLDCSQ